MTVLVTVKAYPSISGKYGEAICAAGIRLDTPTPEWVRLFPVRFRDLPEPRQFGKYEIIRLQVRKHSTDARVETWRPDQDSIERGEVIPAGGEWRSRRDHVEPMLGPTMCELYRGRKGGGDGASLGLVRPARVCGIRVRAETEWSASQFATANQGSLLTAKSGLVKPAHAFVYNYLCEEPECKGHLQKIVDWELGESYRTWPQRGDALVDAIRSKWLDFMCADDREPLFFVGDQHMRPGHFMVLGTFYPKRRVNEAQLTLSLAA